MSNWPNNDVWIENDLHNRAPRPALHECEPTPRINPRCLRFVRGLLQFIGLVSVFFGIITLVFYLAEHVKW